MKLFFLLFLIPISLMGAPKREFHPVQKLSQWFNEEKKRTEGRFFKLATLATTSQDGQPYTRMIELTKVSKKNGLIFFTHKNSQKVNHFTCNERCALNIWLPKTKKQASLIGTISPISDEENQKAWKRFPRSMQLPFIASNHSGTIDSMQVLERRIQELSSQYHKTDIPMPSTFIGYRFTPKEIIFYEIRPRKFPIKEKISLNKDSKWISSLLEP